MVSADNHMVFEPLRKVARLVPHDNDNGEMTFPTLISPNDAKKQNRRASRMSQSEQDMNQTTTEQETPTLPNSIAQGHVRTCLISLAAFAVVWPKLITA
jgi:hypothetical protein